VLLSANYTRNKKGACSLAQRECLRYRKNPVMNSQYLQNLFGEKVSGKTDSSTGGEIGISENISDPQLFVM